MSRPRAFGTIAANQAALVKRRLLCAAALAVALIASQEIAGASEPGWIEDAKSGCRMWNPAPIPNASVAWSGQCQNGLAQGHGTMQWFSNGQPGDLYEGDMKEGHLAKALVTYASGARYDGELDDDGRRSGQGVYIFVNGDRYEGEFRNGKSNGHGVYTTARHDRYEGEFRDGVLSGRGDATYANGDHYEGDFRDGKRDGNGVLNRANGERYEGEFRDNLFNGHGVANYAIGNRYDGDFANGLREGHGVFIFANGDRFEGEFRGNMGNGRGVLAYANGNHYEGEFHDFRPNGHGVYVAANGQRRDGEWQEGKFLGSATEVSEAPSDRSEIPLSRESGVFVVPVLINNVLIIDFALDSGAADVSIPADVVMTLVRAKTLTKSDFIGVQKFVLADGSTIPSLIFRLRSLKVGELEVDGVIASVGNAQGSPLLGQSFLSHFKSWSIDNARQMLVIN